MHHLDMISVAGIVSRESTNSPATGPRFPVNELYLAKNWGFQKSNSVAPSAGAGERVTRRSPSQP